MCNNVEYTKPTKIAKENKLRTFEITMMKFHMCYLQNSGQNKSPFQDGSLVTGVYTLNLVAMVGTIVPQCLFHARRPSFRDLGIASYPPVLPHNQLAKLVHQQLGIKYGLLDISTPPYYKYDPAHQS